MRLSNMWKGSANMSESLGVQNLRTITGINSKTDDLEDNISYDFLNILGVIGISCSFRLVLERLESSEMISANKFTVSNGKDACFISIDEFWRFKILFETFTSLSNLGLRHRRFTQIVQIKTRIYMGNDTIATNHCYLLRRTKC